MNKRVTVHSTFVIERTYPVAPARVFAAWADAKIKAQWFGAPDEGTKSHTLDFWVGGRESSSGTAPNGQDFRYGATYRDIVPDCRIVYAYDMHLDDERISVSLTTVEFRPGGTGTQMTLTEQGAYLDGLDNAGLREHGIGVLLDQLGAVLERIQAA